MGRMKQRVSITLSKEVLSGINKLARGRSRSAFIENVLGDYLRQRARAALNARDLALINANADRLNAEAEDAMSYQTPRKP